MSSGSGDESSPEREAEDQARRNLRWLHAGLYRNAQGSTKDVWFAFKKNKRGKYRIIYASDWFGTSFGNLNVGRWKIDQITWDYHHSKKWEEHITPLGTWESNNATRGRRLQRETLLRTWLDPDSPNIFAHGRDHNRALGPPLNVIHTANDTSRPISRNNRAVRMVPNIHNPAECYPGTSITFSTVKIRVEAYKEIDEDPLGVVANFVSGNLAGNPRFTAHRKDRNDAIEAAFYARGWRLNRRALEKANDEIAAGHITNVFQSKAWRHHPPLWVDRFRGDDLDRLLNQLKDDLGEDDNTDNDDSESTESDANPPNSDLYSDSDSDSDDEGRDLFVKKTSSAGPSNKRARPAIGRPSISVKKSKGSFSTNPEKRSWNSLGSGLNSEGDNEKLDFWSDISPLKYKAPVRKRKSAPIEDLDLGVDAHNIELIVDEARSSPVKQLKSDNAGKSIPHTPDADVDAVSDSEIEIIDELSSPPKIKLEYIGLVIGDDDSL